MRRIVIYYSLEGNTKSAAKTIAQHLDAELFEILPEKSIPKAGGKKFLIGGMQATLGICPPLKDKRFDTKAYDQIILGTPVWAGKCASPVRSFLKKNKIDEKVTAVFTCSGGGNNEGCIRNLKKNLLHIGLTMGLTDQNNPDCCNNESRMMEFIEQLSNDVD